VVLGPLYVEEGNGIAAMITVEQAEIIRYVTYVWIIMGSAGLGMALLLGTREPIGRLWGVHLIFSAISVIAWLLLLQYSITGVTISPTYRAQLLTLPALMVGAVLAALIYSFVKVTRSENGAREECGNG